MININFEANSIQTGGTGIGCVNEYNINWPNLEQELAALKCKTAKENPTLTPVVEELETAVIREDKSSIRKVIEKYAAAFSSATFANLASAGILELIKIFAH